VLETDVLIIGGGVVGLSILEQVPSKWSALLLERHPSFGRETSSRNSEVIHSGIYYAHGSKKTEHCKVGRNELYRFCQERSVPFKRCGKYVVATHPDEEQSLEELAAHCEYEVVPFQIIGKTWLESKAPLLKVSQALFFPLSGILDSHQFMSALERSAKEQGKLIAYNTEFVRLLEKDPWVVEVCENGKTFKIQSKVLINSAGLSAASISNSILNTDRYIHRFCRGRYFQLDSSFRGKFESLIYPLPQKDGLGIHVTKDLSGSVRLGPDTDWCKGANLENLDSFYECNWDELKGEFTSFVRRFMPSLEPEHLNPGFTGIRPKLFIEGKLYSDFLVEHQGHFIHLLGIESPGLTASLSLGKEVAHLIESILQ